MLAGAGDAIRSAVNEQSPEKAPIYGEGLRATRAASNELGERLSGDEQYDQRPERLDYRRDRISYDEN